MRSRFFLTGIFVVALAIQPLMAQTSGRPGGHKHEPLPTPVNLKVLPKDIAPEQLIRIMRGFTGSLGVECSFCHAMNPQTHHLNFPSDAKPEKAAAREMIAMTRAINDAYIAKVHDPDAMPEQKQVTCGTCHRGHSTPEVFIPPPKEQPVPSAEAANPE